jgi:hypothetical protein
MDTADVRVVQSAGVKAPSDLMLNGDVAYNQVQLKWTDASTNETAFVVTRRTAAGAVTTFTVNRSAAQTTATGDVTYTDTGVVENTAYTYTVRAQNAVNQSAESAPLSVTTPLQPMATASGLYVASRTNTTVTLRWTDGNPLNQPGTANESGYRVYRVNAGAPDTLQAAIGANSNTNIPSGLSANTPYTFRVVAYRTVAGAPEQTQDLGTATITTAAGTVTLSAPTGLGVNSNTSLVSWARASTTRNETGYRMTVTPQTLNTTTGVATAGTATSKDLAPTGSVTGSATTAYSTTADGLVAGNLYAFTVAALNVTLTGTVAGPVFVVPGGITAPVASAAQVNTSLVNRISWTAPTAGLNAVSGYRVEWCRGATCTNWSNNTPLTVAGSGNLAVTHTLTRTGTYRYRVTALAAPSAIVSPASSIVSVTVN